MSAVIRHITEAHGVRVTKYMPGSDMNHTDTLEQSMQATRAAALALKADLIPLHRVMTDEQTGFVSVMPNVSTHAEWDEGEPASAGEFLLFVAVVLTGITAAGVLVGLLWGMWL